MMGLEAIAAINRDHGLRVQREIIDKMGPKWFEQRKTTDDSSYRYLLSHIPGETRGWTLELGARDGSAYPLLVELGFEPTFGVDVLEEYVLLGRAEGRALKTSCMECLPFATGMFNCVVSRHSLEHTANPLETVREAARVLVPGGYSAHVIPAFKGSETEPAHLTNWSWLQWFRLWRQHGFIEVWHEYTNKYADRELHMVFQKEAGNGLEGNVSEGSVRR